MKLSNITPEQAHEIAMLAANHLSLELRDAKEKVVHADLLAEAYRRACDVVEREGGKMRMYFSHPDKKSTLICCDSNDANGFCSSVVAASKPFWSK